MSRLHEESGNGSLEFAASVLCAQTRAKPVAPNQAEESRSGRTTQVKPSERPASQRAPRLIPGKLAAPLQSGDAIRRERLVAAVLDAPQALVAVVAPAGFGKTTLLAQLHEACAAAGHPLAWLTLDARDNDPRRFVTYLRAVISRFTVVPEAVTIAPGPGHYFGLGAEAASLLDALAAAGPCTLFLDEVEKVDAPEVLRLLQELFDAVQDGQRLVIGARSLNSFALSAQRLRGRLLHIEAQKLRFDADETRSFFATYPGRALETGEIAQVHARTEGWPAAIRLVALALSGQRDPARWLAALSGRTESIATYLAENVLYGLPPDAARFLVYSSVLEPLNGELCDAVLGRDDGAALLAGFARGNLFLTPFAADTTPSFRFHALFRDFLQAELARLDPEAIPGLHRRAAAWYRTRRRYAPAVEHALAAGDATLAAGIMAECALDFVAIGQVETVAGWLDALSPATIAAQPELQRPRAYAMIALHRYAEAEDALVHCRRGACGGSALEVTILLALMHEFADRHDLARAEIAEYTPLIDSRKDMLNGIARNIMAYHAISRGAFGEAALLLAAAKSAPQGHPDGWADTYAACFEGLIDLAQADPRSALARADAAAARAGGVGAAIAAVYRAQALYELDDDVGAWSLLEEQLSLIRAATDLDTAIICYRTAARAAFLAGSETHVELLLTELAELGDARGAPRPRAAAWLEKSRFALLRGDPEAARRHLDLGANPRLWSVHAGFELTAHDPEQPEVASLRLDLAAGAAERAIAPLRALVERAERGGRRLRRLFLQNLLAQAYDAAGQRPLALRTLEQALAAAAPCGVLRVFADEPWSLAGLLEEIAARPGRIDSAFLRRLGGAVAKLDRRRVALAASRASRALLSPRETAILRLVADGRTNKEIARLLGVTDNTVETHLRRVNQKLETHTRIQAIARAREIGLLER